MLRPRATRRRRTPAFLALSAGLLASACATVPDLGEAPSRRAVTDLAYGWGGSAAWPEDGWWRGYGDPQLAALIEEGLAGSPTIAQAAARLRRAQAEAQRAGAATLPRLDASAEFSAINQGSNNGMPPGAVPRGWNDRGEVALGLSFDLDLWGRNRAALSAATSEAEAAAADAAMARLTISTAIASAYAELARLAAVREAEAGLLDVRNQTLSLMTARAGEGLENGGAVMRAESNRAAAAAGLAATDEAIALTRNSLAALVGEGPGRGRSIALPVVDRLATGGLPADLGIELVGRRPDIVAARLRAEAAGSRIKVARADFYPNVSLSALIGLQAFGLGNLTDAGSTFGSVGPAISLPIFSGGRIEGGYRAARADYDAAVAAYDSTLIDALREVADVAERSQALRKRLAESHFALAAAESAQALLSQRYRGGLATYLELLSAEDSLTATRRQVAELETSAFALDVALVRALGGGFRTPNA